MTYHALLMMCVFSLAISPIIKLYNIDVKWNKAISDYYITCCCFVLFYFSAFRFGIGTDYFNYVDLFNAYKDARTYNVNLEPGFWGLFKVIGYFTDKPEWFFIVTAGAFLFFSYISLDEKYKALHFVLLFLIFYLPSFSLVRQFFAISIFFVALKYVRDSQFKRGLLICLIAPLFHYSSLLYVPLLLISRLSINKYIFASSMVFLCIIFYKFDFFALTQDNPLLSDNKYIASYAGSEFSEMPEIGIGTFIRMLIPLFVMLFIGTIRKNIEISLPRAYINLIYYSSGFYIMALVMSSHIKIFVRLADAFVFAPMLAAMLIPYCVKNKINRNIFIAVVLILYILFFISTVIQAQSSMGSGLGISPYKMQPIY